MRDGTLTRAEGDERSQEKWLTLPGNYPAYYAAIRDALNGVGENPVPASEAIQIMTLIELGIESARHRATLSWSEEEPGSTAAGPVISLWQPAE